MTVADEELLIGRQAPGAGKLGNDIEISRRHARVSRESTGDFLIEDLGSTNGTYVNGERIAGAHVLQAGDELEMGDTKLTVEVLEAPSDRVIAPGGAPPAVTTFAEIPPDLPASDEPTAEEEPEPAAPLLVASSGPISVRVDGLPSGDLELHVDDGGSEARFVRRGGTWSVES
jgi:pSer/pThr/pTyr-binding forkhead associated (FHA) protein